LPVVVDGVSPLIVRTVEVSAVLTLSELNRVLLECFGWSGECLHLLEMRANHYSPCTPEAVPARRLAMARV